MEFLQQLADSSNIPLLTAFILGIMTAISPCPLAMNITATAYLSKEITDKKRCFLTEFSTHWGEFSVTQRWQALFFSVQANFKLLVGFSKLTAFGLAFFLSLSEF